MDELDLIQEQSLFIQEQALKNYKNKQNNKKFVEENIYCVECGIEIPEKRREAIPNTLYCVDCQEEHE